MARHMPISARLTSRLWKVVKGANQYGEGINLTITFRRLQIPLSITTRLIHHYPGLFTPAINSQDENGML